MVRGAAPCSAGKGQGKTCDEVFPVGGKVIAKEGNHRNGFPLLNKHIKFYEEFQEAVCFKKKEKRGFHPLETRLHEKFNEEIQEAVCFIKRNGYVSNKKQEADV